MTDSETGRQTGRPAGKKGERQADYCKQNTLVMRVVVLVLLCSSTSIIM